MRQQHHLAVNAYLAVLNELCQTAAILPETEYELLKKTGSTCHREMLDRASAVKRHRGSVDCREAGVISKAKPKVKVARSTLGMA